MFNQHKVTAACAVLALLVLTAACGGGARALSGQDYFAKLQQLDDASEKSQEQLRSAYDAALANLPDGSAAQGRLSAETDFYTGLVQIGKDYVNAVDDLAPPSEVKAEHDEYVAAYDEVLIQLNQVVDELPAVTTLGGLTALLSNDDLAASFDRANKACAKLQASAPSVDAQVDLHCQA